jgi:SAM-dependent methyltransferase
MEIGQFAALGVVFTYIFVHAVFPLLFPVMPPAKQPSRLPLQRFVNAIVSDDGMWKIYVTLAFGLFMLIFAKPDFHVDLNAMNAVSEETQRADRLVKNVWGDIFSKVYLLVEGRDRFELQRKCDSLAVLLDEEKAEGRVSQFFVASTIFPGEALVRKNAAAWQRFWTSERVAGLRELLREAAPPLGFSMEAFDSFMLSLKNRELSWEAFPQEYAPLLGIKESLNGSAWTQVVSLIPGPLYVGEGFYQRFTATGLVKVFDPFLFSQRLGSLLQSTFLYMAAIVGIVTLLTSFFYFLDWRLTVIGIAPTLFAVVCTLGTLNLLKEPLGIPILIVSVVVIGMGTDYALYLIRAYQRYRDEQTPSLELIRLSVFLSFATTFFGFGVLALSDNSLLKSAGLGLSFGIGYSFIGAVMITPPLLKRVFTPAPSVDEVVSPGSKKHFQRTLARYRHMESYPRLFARFKILLDPMFPRLADFVCNPGCIIDVGSGYGVPAAWLLELFPRARLYGIEPDYRRVRTAARAVGARGIIAVGAAPDLPEIPGRADTALILDMIHMLTDEDLRLTLRRLREKLRCDGKLVMRATVSSLPSAAGAFKKRIIWKRWMEVIRIRFNKGICFFRTEQELRSILSESGYEVIIAENSAPGHEEIWFVAGVRAQM